MTANKEGSFEWVERLILELHGPIGNCSMHLQQGQSQADLPRMHFCVSDYSLPGTSWLNPMACILLQLWRSTKTYLATASRALDSSLSIDRLMSDQSACLHRVTTGLSHEAVHG